MASSAVCLSAWPGGPRAPSQNAYRGSLGQTQTTTVHVTGPRGDLVAAQVHTTIDAVSDPELVERLHADDPERALNIVRTEDREPVRVAVPVVYHDPAAEVLVLVLGEAHRHRELDERIRVLERLREDDAPIPSYAKEFAVVYGASGLRAYLERRAQEALESARTHDTAKERRAPRASELERPRGGARQAHARARAPRRRARRDARRRSSAPHAEIERGARRGRAAPQRGAPSGDRGRGDAPEPAGRRGGRAGGGHDDRPGAGRAGSAPGARRSRDPSGAACEEMPELEPSARGRPSATPTKRPTMADNGQTRRPHRPGHGHRRRRVRRRDHRLGDRAAGLRSADHRRPPTSPIDVVLDPVDRRLVEQAVAGDTSTVIVDKAGNVRLALVAGEQLARGLGGTLDVRVLLHRTPALPGDHARDRPAGGAARRRARPSSRWCRSTSRPSRTARCSPRSASKFELDGRADRARPARSGGCG